MSSSNLLLRVPNPPNLKLLLTKLPECWRVSDRSPAWEVLGDSFFFFSPPLSTDEALLPSEEERERERLFEFKEKGFLGCLPLCVKPLRMLWTNGRPSGFFIMQSFQSSGFYRKSGFLSFSGKKFRLKTHGSGVRFCGGKIRRLYDKINDSRVFHSRWNMPSISPAIYLLCMSLQLSDLCTPQSFLH